MSHAYYTFMRGDRFKVNVTDLFDGNDAPGQFSPADIFTFTVKPSTAKTDADAYVQITDQDRIAIDLDTNTAEITGVASDWRIPFLKVDVAVKWDVQCAVGGDPEQIVTLDWGDGTTIADVTRTIPTP